MLNIELESFIESITPQMTNGLVFVESDNWVADTNGEKLHFEITLRNLQYASTLQTEAIKHGEHEEEKVKETISNLVKFYDLYAERFNSYNELTKDLLLDIAKKSKSEKDRLSKEMEFQSEVTTHFSKLTTIYKKLSLLASEDRVVIPTHDNVRIPLVMAMQVEELFPKVKQLIEKQDAELHPTGVPTESDELDEDISGRSEEEEA